MDVEDHIIGKSMPVRSLTETQIAYVEKFLETAGFQLANITGGHLPNIFELLARLEEFDTPEKFGGWSWELGFSGINRLSTRYLPIIDEWLLSWHRAGLLNKIPGYQRWPDGKNFALVLTHDIDSLTACRPMPAFRRLFNLRGAPAKSRFISLAHFFKQLTLIFSLPRHKRSWPLDIWLDIEASYGFKSSLLFLIDHNAPDWRDGFYRMNDKVVFRDQKIKIGELIQAIAAEGWDVGIHGSINSHNDDAILKEQMDFLSNVSGQPVVSGRQHYLMYDIQTTPNVHETASIQVDSTIGSNIETEYRCGTGLPFFMYDLEADKPMGLLQVPLIIQDGPLERICNSNYELMVGRATEMIEKAADVGGCITLLWHNDCRENDLRYQVYQAILEYAHNLGAWGCSLRDINDWWRSKV